MLGVFCYSIFIVLFAVYSHAYAASPAEFQRPPDQGREVFEQRLRQMEEEQRRSLFTPPPQEAAPDQTLPLREDKGACININSIQVEGASKLSQRRIAKITRPHEGTCLTLSGINSILQELTNAYIEKGYITSRALLEPQDLSQGNLRIRIIEGRVESIELTPQSTMQSRQLMTIFPFIRNSMLDLRDIEQGIDQLNRLPSNKATMTIEPGSDLGASKVMIHNVQERTWRPVLGFDNLGQDNTGRTQNTFGLEKDNFIGVNDQAAFYFTTTKPQFFDQYENEWKEGYSQSVTGLFSIPFGYWLLSGSVSSFHYSTIIKGTNQDYTSKGDTIAARIALDRVIWRDADSKLSLGAFFQYRDVMNYFDEEKLLTSSYRLSSAGLALSYVRRILGGVLSLSLEHAWGLPGMSMEIYGASSSSSPNVPQTDFRKISGSLNWYYPFQLAGQHFAWTLSARGQYSQETLYGSERIYLGSFYTVRGFKETAIGGDSGGYIRNELAWSVPQKWLPFKEHVATGLQVFVAYDYGGIVTDSHDSYVRGEVKGMAVGLRTSGKLALEAAWSRPLAAPDFVRRLDDVWYISLRYTF
jgi:hemolysin activation/secretion protein